MSIILTTNEILSEPIASDVWVKNRTVFIQLTDGRILGFPPNRFTRLKSATDEQLSKVEIRLNGYALRWEELDEDLTVKGILLGNFQLKQDS
ncbi:hypothetical protein AEM51_11120 [Bacteroidetes bacterium UKL13-3]|jgi:hypothetical protein|nr:hypothetical protein AEM51_11120 [Bacteroidetes bacterium UKL13-3]HCP92792.1 DUF2442 domain-containing protein [Bacteroidota bacterium]